MRHRECGIINWILTDGRAAGSLEWNEKPQVAAVVLPPPIHAQAVLCLCLVIVFLFVWVFFFKALPVPSCPRPALAPSICGISGQSPLSRLGLPLSYSVVLVCIYYTVPKLMPVFYVAVVFLSSPPFYTQLLSFSLLFKPCSLSCLLYCLPLFYSHLLSSPLLPDRKSVV